MVWKVHKSTVAFAYHKINLDLVLFLEKEKDKVRLPHSLYI
jgi:hypothetical protein